MLFSLTPSAGRTKVQELGGALKIKSGRGMAGPFDEKTHGAVRLEVTTSVSPSHFALLLNVFPLRMVEPSRPSVLNLELLT